MPAPSAHRHLYLPERDRSFWKADEVSDVPLRYLAWGGRDFARQPIPASRHHGWVCVLIQEGAPTMVAGQREIRMPAGTVAWIGPDCPFGWSGAAFGPARFLLWMWRSAPPALDGPPQRAGLRTQQLPRSARRPLVHVHDLCRREVLRPSGPDPAYLEGCRILFDCTLIRVFDTTLIPGARAGDVVAQAETWLAAHLDSREPVARLCDYLDVSQSTLYRLFREAHGVSPLSWFQQARMRKAHELLAQAGLSVKETAYALGYEHGNDLSRAYRRHFGRRPSDARRPPAASGGG